MCILEILNSFRKGCIYGRVHTTAIQDVQIDSGLVHKVGEILQKNNFPKCLLVVCDKNTLKASQGIVESLSDFCIEYKIYEDLRVAKMENVEEVENLIRGKDIGVLSVGSGSLNDICRLASARPAIESQAKIPTKRKIILRNFKCEKRAQKQAVLPERRQYLIGSPIKY